MIWLIISLIAIWVFSTILIVATLDKEPSSKLYKLLREICDLLRDVLKTLMDFCDTIKDRIAQTVRLTIDSPEFKDKIREQVKEAIEEHDGMKTVRLESIEDFQPIEFADVPITEPEPPVATGMSHEEIEESVTKEVNVQEYGDRFFYDNYGSNKRDNGGNILVRDTNRAFLRALAERSGVYNITLSAYLDNIITDHIQRYEDEIREVVGGKYSPDNLNNSANL